MKSNKEIMTERKRHKTKFIFKLSFSKMLIFPSSVALPQSFFCIAPNFQLFVCKQSRDSAP